MSLFTLFIRPQKNFKQFFKPRKTNRTKLNNYMKYEYKICKLGVLFGIFGTMNTFIPSPAPKLKVAEKVLPKVVRIFQQTFEFLR